MDYLPLFFDLKGQSCLLVGGGDVAQRKALLLERAGAIITVVSPEINAELAVLVESSGGELIRGDYQSGLLDNKVLVVAATDNPVVNQQVHQDATGNNLPVNVVDSPELCTFIFPAIVDRSPLMVAVSSGGKSPVLARLLRARLETLIPAYYGQLSEMAGRFRGKVKAKFKTIRQRRAFWEQMFQGPIAEKMISGNPRSAELMMEQALSDEVSDEPAVGEVYLVGAGPGDPELLTFKALRLMQQADVVLYDRLVSPEIVDLCRRDSDRIYVGKERSNHAVPQEDINELLARLALEGKRVLRLKGGDPFIFGRGGEELETLAAQGVPFQVVPGITAASACSSYSGIPLTHRDYAQSVKFITGQLKNRTSDLNWPELVHPNQTIVFYMGLHRLQHICTQMIAHGKPEETPVALVQAGSTPQQKVLIGTLETINEKLKETPLSPPTLTIVGEVVNLHEKLAWFNEAVKSDNHALMTAEE
ncbi:siroheme synthase CysG [Motiliproteus sp. MSK22-1]|uniref:siroheme synthase CysG n=1 Tax=Motiliproteus sp. MSK22-1 TaxID=1897630 RepID=UPI000978CEDE|nr:siroheme synthase CysG [Motiliproteus sp. MSK22-1]OMH33764.1 uroporphyrinogen-III C-methyltransferase [Motiliproteus sp. MSK22-1]